MWKIENVPARPASCRFIIDWQRFCIRNLTIARLQSAAFEFIVEGPSHWQRQKPRRTAEPRNTAPR
jgi:hypothetical protein